MVPTASKVSLVAILGMALLIGASSGQEKNAPHKVRDEANLFSLEAIEKVNAIVAKIKEKHGKDLWIETVKEIPPADVKEPGAWARARFDKQRIDGVYIVIANQPKHFEIVFGNKTGAAGLFTQADANDIIATLKKNLREDRDEALLSVAVYTLAAMDRHGKTSTDLKDLTGKWLGATVEVAAKRKDEIINAKGELYVKFSVVGKIAYLDLGYEARIGEGGSLTAAVSLPIEVKHSDKKQQITVNKFDAEGPLTLTYEIAGDTLKLASSRKVRLPDITDPVDLNGIWKKVVPK